MAAREVYLGLKLIAFITVGFFAITACRPSQLRSVVSHQGNGPSSLVERVDHVPDASDPLLILVDFCVDQRIRINKIEVGEMSDTQKLVETLNVIFDERQMAGIADKTVYIQPCGKVNSIEIDSMVDRLRPTKASPIRLLESNQVY